MAWLNDEGWSEPIRIDTAIDVKWWERVPSDRKGIYRLVALADSNDFIPARLSRVCGTDATGTLYIGGSDQSVANRLGSLVRTHSPVFGGQPGRPLPKPLEERFPANKLAISWKLTNEPWQHEQELLKAYEEEFGELPPMNNQTPKWKASV